MWSASLLEFYKKSLYFASVGHEQPVESDLCAKFQSWGANGVAAQKTYNTSLMVTFLGRLELHSLDLLLSFCFVKDFRQCITCKLITATLIHIAHSLTSI